MSNPSQAQPISPDLIARKNRELSALVEMNQEIHSTIRIQRLLQILVEKAVVGLNFERGLIYLLEDDYLRCVAFLDRVKREKASLITKRVGFDMSEKSVEVLVAKLGKSIFVHDAHNDVRISPKFLKVTNVKQYCVVPLIGRERVLGVFTGDKYYSEKPILPEDIETLELFAGHISLAIENAKLYEDKEHFNKLLEEKVELRTKALAETNQKLSSKMRELSTLFRVSQLLNKSLEVGEILSQVLTMILQLGHSRCAIHILKSHGSPALFSRGLNPEYRQATDIPLSSLIRDRIQNSSDPFLVGKIQKEITSPPFKDYCRENRLEQCLIVPLCANQAAVAAILIYQSPQTPDEEDRKKFFLSFARQAGAALEKALLFQDMVQQKHNIEIKSEKLERENIYLKDKFKTDFEGNFLVGDSPGMKEVMDSVSKVAPTDATVILYGETGTGKELVAKAIHSLSKRKDSPLITVNCAAIPDELLECELFGHEKGAFTGAHQKRIGMFELAHGGSIFLDEIGELSPQTQKKLLRVLQESEVQVLGSKAPRKVDVRVIAATNRDLKQEMESGRFRADLYYRLNVFPMQLPPLRERAEDIPSLIKLFLNRYGGKKGEAIKIHREVFTSFMNYHWPGNIRELENIIERLVIVCREGRVTLNDLPIEIRGRINVKKQITPLREATQHFKKEMVLEALAQAEGKKSRAAKMLGLAPSNLTRLLKSLNLG
ncbi:MAG: sigma 54-interacting transcriptional regulator [Desulfarculaceae bacterium]|jgi:transcriptional regulator with GAF, ATPase, and Fis domain